MDYVHQVMGIINILFESVRIAEDMRSKVTQWYKFLIQNRNGVFQNCAALNPRTVA